MQEAKSAPVLAIVGSVDVSVTTGAGGRLAALSMQNAGAAIDSEASLVRLPTIRPSIAQTVVAS